MGAAMLVVTAAMADDDASSRVDLIPYEGAITPVSAEFLVDGLVAAELRGADAVVIELDTPGGLDTSMRDHHQGACWRRRCR